MHKAIDNALVLICVVGVLLLACLGAPGCAPVAPPRHQAGGSWPTHPDVPVHAAVMLHGNGWACSGVAVGEHEVLTAKHCTDMGEFEVEYAPGEITMAAMVASYDDRDVAIVYTYDELSILAEVAPFRPLPGTLVYAVGFGCAPGKGPGMPTVHVGAYIEPDMDSDLVLAMAVCNGDSGGPVFDQEGRVFALISKRANPFTVPLAFAAPLEGL